MGWFILSHIFSTVLSLIQIGRLSDKDRDLEVIILRHQLAVMTRLHAKPVKPNRAEKMTLAVLTTKLKRSKNRTTHQLRRVIRIVQPETLVPCKNYDHNKLLEKNQPGWNFCIARQLIPQHHDFEVFVSLSHPADLNEGNECGKYL